MKYLTRPLVLLALFAVVLTALAVVTTTPADAAGRPTSLAEWVAGYLPPCAAEDSRNCHWDAQLRGNGRGRSFVNVGGTVYQYGPVQ